MDLLKAAILCLILFMKSWPNKVVKFFGHFGQCSSQYSHKNSQYICV